MTKEELKQEAKEYADKYGKSNFDLWDTARFAYYQGAEPRENQIQIDAEHIIALQNQNRELTDKVKELEVRCNELFLQTCEQAEKIKELEAQIEKIKLCQICKHYQWESCNYHPLNEKDCKANNHKLFELVGDKRK